MADMKPTRNQRRQIDKLAPDVLAVLDADIAFFEQHPERRYRVRRAVDAEIAHAEIFAGEPFELPQGWCWFVIVKKVPGSNLRMFVANEPAAETALPDWLSEAMWEGAPPEVKEVWDAVTIVANPATVINRSTRLPSERTPKGTRS